MLDHRKASEFQENIDFCLIDYTKTFDCVDHNKLENSSRDGKNRPPDLPPWKESYDQHRQHIKKQRHYFVNLKSKDITLSTKVCLVKAMVFPVVMYGCESWTIKKAECQRIDAFELWCWRRLLRVPWTARRSNQSILKEISTEYSLKELMLLNNGVGEDS